MMSRIPLLKSNDLNGLQLWYCELAENNLLIHPDDEPNEVVSILTGQKLFNEVEVKQLQRIMRQMFSLHGDLVYETAYPVFMRILENIQLR